MICSITSSVRFPLCPDSEGELQLRAKTEQGEKERETKHSWKCRKAEQALSTLTELLMYLFIAGDLE